MKVNVRKAQQAAKEAEMAEQTSKVIEYVEALGCQFCRDLRGFGKARLNRLMRGAYVEMMEYYEHYGGEVEKGILVDEVPTLYIGLRNQVKCLDVPVDEIEEGASFSPEFAGWRNETDRMMRRFRHGEIERKEKVVRSFWYAMMVYLWHTYGWGQVRLSNFYRTVQFRYRTAMGYYLECRSREDALVNTELDVTVEAIKKLGVEL